MPVNILKNKFFVIIMVLLIISGVVIAWFYWSKVKSQILKTVENKTQTIPEKKPNDNAIKEEKTTDPVRQKNIIYEEAIKNGDIKKCEELSDVDDKNLCLKYVAVKIFQTSICEKIADEKIKEDCLNEVNLASSKNNQDIVLCNKISNNNLKIACIEFVISSYKNSSDCEKLPNEERGICLMYFNSNEANEKKDITYCQKMSKDYWEECFQEILIDNEDINTCKKMAGDAQEICNNIIGYNLAYEKNDAKYCQYIIDTTKKNDCLKEVEENSDNDNDGLSNYAETFYGTDPNKKDTDGDGHSDSEEVKNGFNPLGEGKLNSNIK